MSTPGHINAGGAVVTITARENVQKTLSNVEKQFGTFAGRLDGLRKTTEALKLYAVARGFAEVGRAVQDASRQLAEGASFDKVAGDLIRNTMLLGDFVKGWDALAGVLTGDSAINALLDATAKSADTTATALEKAQTRLESFARAAGDRIEKYRQELALLNEQPGAGRDEMGVRFGAQAESSAIQRDAKAQADAIAKEFDAPIADLEKRTATLRMALGNATEQGALGVRGARIAREQREALTTLEAQLSTLRQSRDAQREQVAEQVRAQEAALAQAEAARLNAIYQQTATDAVKDAADLQEKSAEDAVRRANALLSAFNLTSGAIAAVRDTVARYAEDPVAAVRSGGMGGSLGGQFGGQRLSQLAASSTPKKLEQDIRVIAEEAKQQTKIQKQTLDAIETSLAPTFT